MSLSTLQEIVDGVNFPIHDPGNPDYHSMVAFCQARLRKDGIVELPGFLSAKGIRDIRNEAERLTPLGHPADGRATVYSSAFMAGQLPDPRFTPDHPRNTLSESVVSAVACDLIQKDSPLLRLYESHQMKRFIADAFALEAVHPFTDPLFPLNILEYGEGGRSDWHFDGGRYSPFTVLLDIRPAGCGGNFEYVPNVRSRYSENYEDVGRVLHGDTELVHNAGRSSGTLVLLVGTRTMHRVTPVLGATSRLVAVLSYSPLPDMRVADPFLLARFGRAS